MTEEENILNAWEEHFRSLSAKEIAEDIEKVNSIGSIGVSYEDYLYILNTVTSHSLAETGLCDDIAFADFFNRTIIGVEMGKSNTFTIIKDKEILHIVMNDSIVNEMFHSVSGENTYAMAA